MPLGTVKEFAVDADVVFVRIGFGAEGGDGLAIHEYVTGRDQFLGLAARGDSGGGDNFLKAFGRHGEDQFLMNVAFESLRVSSSGRKMSSGSLASALLSCLVSS